MDHDGISIDTVRGDETDVDLNAYLVELTGVFGQVLRASEQLATGLVAEVTVHTEKISTLMRPLNAEYFLALAIKPNGNTGKARYLMRVAGPRILEELAA
jgi:predicted regulator of Ras-like GTPase activity (Roadblock/LC7/MglB family)